VVHFNNHTLRCVARDSQRILVKLDETCAPERVDLNSSAARRRGPVRLWLMLALSVKLP